MRAVAVGRAAQSKLPGPVSVPGTYATAWT